MSQVSTAAAVTKSSMMHHEHTPHLQVVDAIAPLVHQPGWWLMVTRLDPVGEQHALVCLVPDVLVKVAVSDLLQRLNLIHGNQMTVQVHELNRDLEQHISK